MGFAENLRALLEQYDISQNALAETIGVSAPTVSRWLSGTMSVRTAHLEALCSEFEVSKDDLTSDSHGLAAQLSARTYGIEPAASVPLLDACDVDPWLEGAETPVRRRVQVPREVARNRPRAFACLNLDCGMDRAVPLGAHVVIDPDAQPGNSSVVAVRAETGGSLALRRLHRGNSVTMLATDSNTLEEDLVLQGGEAQAQVAGVVVWYQAADVLR